jgi:hypothetical protein
LGRATVVPWRSRGAAPHGVMEESRLGGAVVPHRRGAMLGGVVPWKSCGDVEGRALEEPWCTALEDGVNLARCIADAFVGAAQCSHGDVCGALVVVPLLCLRWRKCSRGVVRACGRENDKNE